MLTVKKILNDSNFSVRVNSSCPKLCTDFNNEVEDLWLSEQNRLGKSIFNGSIMSATHISKSGVDGYIVEYKKFIAQMARPNLFDNLQIRPIALSGLLECADGFVFGRRSKSMTQDSGLWELVPSGGLDTSNIIKDKEDIQQENVVYVNFLRQILIESQEELGIKSNFISHLSPFCLVDDSDSHVIDIGISMKTPLSFDEILMAHHNSATNEYHKLRLVRQSEMSQFIQSKAHCLVGVSKALLQKYF